MSRSKSAGTTEHGYFEERLSAYLDGELTSREHEAVEHHLETCSDLPMGSGDAGADNSVDSGVAHADGTPGVHNPRPGRAGALVQAALEFPACPTGCDCPDCLLLVFAVGGDLMFSNLSMGSAPDTAYQQEVAPSSIEGTRVVEKAVEEPVAAEAERELERTVVEDIVVESEAVVTPTEAPMALGIAPTEPLVSGEAMAAAATPRAPGAEDAWRNAEEEVKEEDGEQVADAAAAPPAEEGAVAGGGELTLTLPVPSPLRKCHSAHRRRCRDSSWRWSRP